MIKEEKDKIVHMKLSKKDIEALKKSEEDIKYGRVINAEDVFKIFMEKYGIKI